MGRADSSATLDTRPCRQQGIGLGKDHSSLPCRPNRASGSPAHGSCTPEERPNGCAAPTVPVRQAYLKSARILSRWALPSGQRETGSLRPRPLVLEEVAEHSHRYRRRALLPAALSILAPARAWSRQRPHPPLRRSGADASATARDRRRRSRRRAETTGRHRTDAGDAGPAIAATRARTHRARPGPGA
jgi:hypothetical protein